MKTEVSGGGVVVKKVNNNLLVLLIKDRQGDWMLPKGWIEPNETTETAAEREIREETRQTSLTRLTTLSPVRYQLHRGREKVDKTVHFILFYQQQDMPVASQGSEGISEAGWFPYEAAFDMIAYPGSYIPVLTQAQEYLEQHPI